ncbi:uncharacterized protein [Dermacentor albipictus]|uniref:uncharacterized protein n=1 Tax=Dermacentor albipictus TaxID=60249 RepID=UPI0038FCC7E7
MKFRMTYEVPRWTTLRGSPSVHSSFAATAFLANDEACTTRPPGHRLRPPTTDFPVPCRVPDGRRCAAHLLRTSAPASQPLLSWRMKKPALPALQYIDCALSQRICLCLACPRRMTLRGSPSMHFSSSLAATAFMANEETCTARPAVH